MVLLFDEFAIDVERLTLRDRTRFIEIQPKPLELLILLARNEGRVVSLEAIHDALWPEVTVTESSITRAVSAARRALGGGPRAREILRNVHGRGYRLDVSVTVAPSADASAVQSAQRRDAEHGPVVAGRIGELSAVEDVLSQTMRDRSTHIVAFSGSAGVGKSLLLGELGVRAASRGFHRLSSRFHEGDQLSAHSLVSEWLRQGEGRSLGKAAPLSDAEREAARFLTRLVQGDLDPGGADLRTPPLGEIQRLMQARLEPWARSLRDRTPLLIACDDAHWADPSSMRLLQLLGRSTGAHGLILALTFREGCLDFYHPLTIALEEWRHEARFHSIPLLGLSAADTRAMLCDLLADEISDTLANEIHRAADGNPFFIRHLGEELRRSEREEDVRWGAEVMLRTASSEEFGRWLARMLRQLPAAGARMLEAASISGEPFSLARLTEISDVGDDEALEVAERCVAQRLWSTTEEPDEFRFTHDLVREAWVARMTSARRLRLHRRAAQTLEARPGQAGRAAFHYHQSRALEGRERSVAACLTAAEEARARAAHTEALAFLGMARDLTESEAMSHEVDRRATLILARCGHATRAAELARTTAEAMAKDAGPEESAAFLCDAADAIWSATYSARAFDVAAWGLAWNGAARGRTWLRLMMHVLAKESAESAESLGIALDTRARREVEAAIVDEPDLQGWLWSRGFSSVAPTDAMRSSTIFRGSLGSMSKTPSRVRPRCRRFTRDSAELRRARGITRGFRPRGRRHRGRRVDSGALLRVRVSARRRRCG